MTRKIKVAIDGYSSCGKSSMAKYLAKQSGYIYVDTGAMYRAVTLYALRHGYIADGVVNEHALVANLDKINLTFSAEGHVLLNDVDVEPYIRSMEVSDNVYKVSSIAEVREHLVAMQREIGKNGGVVMDGRDIGTVVFPDAELKVFVSASAEKRAERRYKELIEKGYADISYEAVLKNIKDRDYSDEHRKTSPLRKADDAESIDNSDISIEEQNKLLMDLFNKHAGFQC